MNGTRNLALCITIIALGAGCASTTQFAPFPDQSKRIEDPDKARIYVVRSTSFGGAVTMKVSDGETVIGKTGARGYLCWERDPGNMEVIGKAENTARLAMPVEKDTVYYIQQHVHMGALLARNSLSQLTESEGKEQLEKCKPPKAGE